MPSWPFDQRVWTKRDNNFCHFTVQVKVLRWKITNHEKMKYELTKELIRGTRATQYLDAQLLAHKDSQY